MGMCERCREAGQDATVPDDEILDHLRIVHPDDYGDGPGRWSDGTVVVYDLTLQPEDFGPPA